MYKRQVLTVDANGEAGFAAASATISNNADNRVITGGSGTNLNGEANLTFDGTNLDLASNNYLRLGGGNEFQIWHNGGTGNSNIKQVSGSMYFYTGNDLNMLLKDGTSVDLYYANNKKFETTNTGATVTGNLAFASGNGIDFSANTDGGGTSTATLLDDYEEGSYTITSNTNLTLDNTRTGYYTKIGNMVNVIGYLSLNTNNGSPSVSGTNGIVLSLPYARDTSTAAYTGTMLQQNIDSDTPTSLVGHPLWYKVLPVDYVCMAASDGLRFYINKIEAAYTRMNNSHLHVGYPGYTYIVWNITYRTN